MNLRESGWWFGCHQLYFPIFIGLISSSQLTNSYFSEGWLKTTNQEYIAPIFFSWITLFQPKIFRMDGHQRRYIIPISGNH